MNQEQSKITKLLSIYNVSEEKLQEFLQNFPSFANIYLHKDNVKKWIIENVTDDALALQGLIVGIADSLYSNSQPQPVAQPVTQTMPTKIILETAKKTSELAFPEALDLLINGNLEQEVIDRLNSLTFGKKVFCVTQEGVINKEATLSLFKAVIQNKQKAPDLYKGFATVTVDFFLAQEEYMYLPNGDMVLGSEFEDCSEDDIRFYHFACSENPALIETEIDPQSLVKKTAPFKKLWVSYQTIKKSDQKWKNADASMRGSSEQEQIKEDYTPTKDYYPPQNFSGANLNVQSELRDFLIKYFSLDEIKAICFNIGIDPEIIPGSAKDKFAQELTSYCARRGHYSELIQEVMNARPMFFTQRNVTVINGDYVGRDKITTQVNYVDNRNRY